MSTEFDETKKKLTEDDILDEQIQLADADNMDEKQLDRLYKRLEFKLKRAELGIKLDEAARANSARAQKLEEYKFKMQSLKNFLANRESTQKSCNHRKGARGVDGVMRRQGTDPNYSIIRHQMIDGNWWVCCTNCGKEWDKLTPGYLDAAFNWPTDNSPSGQVRFIFERIAV